MPASTDDVAEVSEKASAAPAKVLKTNVTDKASALAEMAYATGVMVGPIAGGALEDWRGFQFTTNAMACAMLFFAFVYLLVV